MEKSKLLPCLFVLLPIYNPSKVLFGLTISSLLSEIARNHHLYSSIYLLVSLNDRESSQDLFASVFHEKLHTFLSTYNNILFAIFSNLKNDGYPHCFINLIRHALLLTESVIKPHFPHSYITFFDQDDYILPGRLEYCSNFDLQYSRDILSTPSFISSSIIKSNPQTLDRPPSSGHTMTVSQQLARMYISQIDYSITYTSIAHDLGLYLVALQNNMTFFDQKRVSMIYIQHNKQTIPVPTLKRLLNIQFFKNYLRLTLYYIHALTVLFSSFPKNILNYHRLSSNLLKSIIIRVLLIIRKG